MHTFSGRFDCNYDCEKVKSFIPSSVGTAFSFLGGELGGLTTKSILLRAEPPVLIALRAALLFIKVSISPTSTSESGGRLWMSIIGKVKEGCPAARKKASTLKLQ
jgi:hypothetical protein